MSRDPFKIDGPTCISFQRRQDIRLHAVARVAVERRTLPEECIVRFANTGKEEEATLRFVRDCGERWGVPITWVEYRADAPGFAVVYFETASRNGEPFAALIARRNTCLTQSPGSAPPT